MVDPRIPRPLYSPQENATNSDLYIWGDIGGITLPQRGIRCYPHDRPWLCEVPRIGRHIHQHNHLLGNPICCEPNWLAARGVSRSKSNASTGNLRFRAPQAPNPVAGVIQATSQPDQCFQAAQGTSSTNPLRAREVNTVSSEDCLFLRSDFHARKKLFMDRFTVCLFQAMRKEFPAAHFRSLFGFMAEGTHVLCTSSFCSSQLACSSRYLFGSSSQYRGTDLVKESNNGLVVVIIQYRLGVFGKGLKCIPSFDVLRYVTLQVSFQVQRSKRTEH